VFACPNLNQVFGQANTLVTGLSPSAKVTMIAEKYAQSNHENDYLLL
jgi:transcription-repair coupling factor (superfamily II helicase)